MTMSDNTPMGMRRQTGVHFDSVTVTGPREAAAGGVATDLRRSTESHPSEVRGSRLGHIGLLMILCSGLLLCVAASKTNVLLPASIRPVAVPPLAGAFSDLSFYLPAGGVLGALTVMFIGYVLAVRHADRLSPRLVLATITSFILIVLLAPPLISTDVFSYQEYARIFFGLHLDPYTNTAQVLALDPLEPYIGARWINTPTVYGPLFTLLSGLFANTSTTATIAFSAYAYKTIAAISCLGIVCMLWKAAKLRDINPVRGVALFGLNPLVVFYGVGGGHNDLLMMAFSTAGIRAQLTRDQRSSGALIVAGAAIKLTGAIFLPFALVGNSGPGAVVRRRRFLLGAAVAAVITIGVGIAAFGSGLGNMIHTLGAVQSGGGWQSVPVFVDTALHWESLQHLITTLFAIAFVMSSCRLLWRISRHELDWLAGAGWGTFWLLVTTASVQPWYVSWMLVPVALCANRKLHTAAIAFTGWVLLASMMYYLPHSPTILGFHA